MKPANVLLEEDDTPILMDFGSMGQAKIEIKGTSEARTLQASDECAVHMIACNHCWI